MRRFPLINVKIEKYAFGTGDRFAHQGRAQLQAILKAREAGVDVHPVWNKSNRVMAWSSARYANALRHVESSPEYNPYFRQLLHVGFKVAAGMDKRFTEVLEANAEIVGRNVTENLFDRHLKPIFA